jgi:uncharacterized protein with PIN domain
MPRHPAEPGPGRRRAPAKGRNNALLFKGGDFAQTDVKAAI